MADKLEYIVEAQAHAPIDPYDMWQKLPLYLLYATFMSSGWVILLHEHLPHKYVGWVIAAFLVMAIVTHKIVTRIMQYHYCAQLWGAVELTFLKLSFTDPELLKSFRKAMSEHDREECLSIIEKGIKDQEATKKAAEEKTAGEKNDN